MALTYGLNLPSSQVKQILEQNDKQQSGVRTWQQLFGGASLGFNAKSDAITTDYSGAMAEAYKSNFEQNASIMGGNLSQGNTRQLLSMSRQELSDTYNTYMNNYAKSLNDAATDYNTEISAIDTARTEIATNITKTLDYLRQYGRDELSAATFEDKNYLSSTGLDWMLYSDEEAAAGLGIAGELKSDADLDKLLYASGGELTDKGIAYFDALLNAETEGYKTLKDTGTAATKGFDEWLSSTDADLREWLVSSDDFNYSKAGTNRGMINILTGRESTDDTYERAAYDKAVSGEENVKALRENIKSAVWSTLENNKRDGINTISEIGNRKKKVGGKLKTYDEWFEKTQKTIDNSVGGLIWRGQADNIIETMNSFVSDYKAYSKTEYETFKSEIINMLGDTEAKEFLKTYGKELTKLYTQVQTYDKKASALSNDIVTESAIAAKNALAAGKGIKELGFDKQMEKIYADLEKYMNKEIATERENLRKSSGF